MNQPLISQFRLFYNPVCICSQAGFCLLWTLDKWFSANRAALFPILFQYRFVLSERFSDAAVATTACSTFKQMQYG